MSTPVLPHAPALLNAKSPPAVVPETANPAANEHNAAAGVKPSDPPADVPKPQAPPVVKKRAPVTNYPSTEEVHCRYLRRLPIPILENRHINWRQALTGIHGVSPLTLIERESGAAILIRRNGVVAAKKPEAINQVELPSVTNTMAQSPLPNPKVMGLAAPSADRLGGSGSRGGSPNASNVAIPPTAPQTPLAADSLLPVEDTGKIDEGLIKDKPANFAEAPGLTAKAVTAELPQLPETQAGPEAVAALTRAPMAMTPIPTRGVNTPVPPLEAVGPVGKMTEPQAGIEVEPANKEDRDLKDLLDKMHEQAKQNPGKTPGDLLDSDFFRRMAGFGDLPFQPPASNAQQVYDEMMIRHRADRLRMIESPLWNKTQDLAILEDLDEDLIQLIESQQDERRKARQAVDASITDGGLHFLVLSQHVSEAEDCLDRLRHLLDMILEDHEDEWTSEDEEEETQREAKDGKPMIGLGGKIEAQIAQPATSGDVAAEEEDLPGSAKGINVQPEVPAPPPAASP